jgi:arylsulfatase A-like enzyme
MQESLESVDEAVARTVQALRDAGRLDNTLIVFTSDNGLMLGEHRLFVRKNVPYRWSTDVPLVLRWDGHVAAGARDRRLALNVDIAATVASAAGISMPTEGLNLLGAVRRDGYPLEATRYRLARKSLRPPYCGYRTRRYMFARYNGGFEELYDYRRDPQELTNVANRPRYEDVVTGLRERAHAECSPTPPGFSW